MKRFINLTNQDIPYRFAWWDTCADKFETHSGNLAWHTFEEFAYDYVGNDLESYYKLAPEWTHDIEHRSSYIELSDKIVVEGNLPVENKTVVSTRYQNNIPMTERRETYGYNEKGEWVKLKDTVQPLQYLKMIRSPETNIRGNGR